MTWIIPCILAALLIGAIAGGKLVKRLWLAKYRMQSSDSEHAKRERDVLYTWLLLDQNHADHGEFYTSHGFRTIAVFGMGPEGRRYVEALNRSGVEVVYAVELDNPAAVHETLTVYRLGDDPLPPADCMVITDLRGVREKAEAARKEFQGDIVTLAQVLAWMLERKKLKPRDGAIEVWPPDELLGKENA